MKTLEELGYKKVIDNNKTIEYECRDRENYSNIRIVIDRNKGVQKIEEYTTSLGCAEESFFVPLSFREVLACAEIIENMPDVKTAYWIDRWYYRDGELECEHCGYKHKWLRSSWYMGNEEAKYCPNCHCKMIDVIKTTQENDS